MGTKIDIANLTKTIATEWRMRLNEHLQHEVDRGAITPEQLRNGEIIIESFPLEVHLSGIPRKDPKNEIIVKQHVKIKFDCHLALKNIIDKLNDVEARELYSSITGEAVDMTGIVRRKTAVKSLINDELIMQEYGSKNEYVTVMLVVDDAKYTELYRFVLKRPGKVYRNISDFISELDKALKPLSQLKEQIQTKESS